MHFIVEGDRSYAIFYLSFIFSSFFCHVCFRQWEHCGLCARSCSRETLNGAWSYIMVICVLPSSSLLLLLNMHFRYNFMFAILMHAMSQVLIEGFGCRMKFARVMLTSSMMQKYVLVLTLTLSVLLSRTLSFFLYSPLIRALIHYVDYLRLT